MPAIPWKTFAEVEPARAYLVLASRLPLRSYRKMPAFLRMTLVIRRQLAQAPGLVGYSLLAEPLSKTFWTLSAWGSQAELDTFVRALPHADVMRQLRPHMTKTAFTTWSAPGSALPITWADAKARLVGGRERPTRPIRHA